MGSSMLDARAGKSRSLAVLGMTGSAAELPSGRQRAGLWGVWQQNYN